MIDITCNECAHWLDLDDETGQCRRYAPKPRTSDTGWQWPITSFYDWCAEAEPVETTCDCDDDEACPICEPDATHIDIDQAFNALIRGIDNNETPRRRWWGRHK